MKTRLLFILSTLVIWSLCALIVGGSGLALGETLPTPAPTTPPLVSPFSPLTESEFGLAFINSAENPSGRERIERGAATGVSMDRFPLYWDRIETGYNQYDYRAQDRVILANEAQGLDTLAVLLGVPGHYASGSRAQAYGPFLSVGGSFVEEEGAVRSTSACARGDGPPAPSGLWNPVFADGTDQPAPGKRIHPDNPWAQFVARTVERYRPGGELGTNIRHWEVWNEPDLCHFWSGTVEEYARLLKTAYLVIHHIDPQAFVLWGGLAHFADGEWLGRLVDELSGDPTAADFGGYFDAAASHHYSLSWLGYQYTDKIRDTLIAAGWGDKPIWITESGVPVCDDYPGPNCPSDWRARPLEQAAYIWQNIGYTRLAGGGPIFHFMLHDDCGNEVTPTSPDGFGLAKNEASSYCSPAQAEPRLAYSAFQLANQYFPGTELVWADIANGTARRFGFFHHESRERRLLTWALRDEAEVAIPATGESARLIRLDGSETLLTPEEGVYRLALPAAGNRNWPRADGSYEIGIYGEPFLLVEADTLPPLAELNPLPETSWPEFEVRWSARDWGAGVESVEIWARVDEGEWSLHERTEQANGRSSYSGTVGSRVQFGLVAVDRLGQRSDGPEVQGETRIIEKPTHVLISGSVVDLSGSPAPDVEVQIGTESFRTDGEGRFEYNVPFGSWDILVDGRLQNHQRRFEADGVLRLLYNPGEEAIINGTFEQGIDGWTRSGSSPLRTEPQPGTADSALRLGSAFVPNPGVPGEEGSDGGNSTVVQRIQIPTGRPYLALAYRVESGEIEAGHDRFEVILAVDGAPAKYLLIQETAAEWQYGFFDLSQYAGTGGDLILNLYESSPRRRTSALVDLVSLGDLGPILFDPSDWLYLPRVQR